MLLKSVGFNLLFFFFLSKISIECKWEFYSRGRGNLAIGKDIRLLSLGNAFIASLLQCEECFAPGRFGSCTPSQEYGTQCSVLGLLCCQLAFSTAFAWRAPASLRVLLSWHTVFAASSGNPGSSAQLKKKKNRGKIAEKSLWPQVTAGTVFPGKKRGTETFFLLCFFWYWFYGGVKRSWFYGITIDTLKLLLPEKRWNKNMMARNGKPFCVAWMWDVFAEGGVCEQMIFGLPSRYPLFIGA